MFVTNFWVGEKLVTFSLPVNYVKCLILNFAEVFIGLWRLQLMVSFSENSADASLVLKGRKQSIHS